MSEVGRIPDERMARLSIQIDPARAVATCLKPADGDGDRGFILRLWETAGKPDAVRISVDGYGRAIRTDLLERDQEELAISEGHIEARMNPHGFYSVRLLPRQTK